MLSRGDPESSPLRRQCQALGGAGGPSAATSPGLAPPAVRDACRVSRRRPPFVVGLSKDPRTAHVVSTCGREVAVAPAVFVGDISNAFDLCDRPRLPASGRSLPL